MFKIPRFQAMVVYFICKCSQIFQVFFRPFRALRSMNTIFRGLAPPAKNWRPFRANPLMVLQEQLSGAGAAPYKTVNTYLYFKLLVVLRNTVSRIFI
jgi:hypothetical protein